MITSREHFQHRTGNRRKRLRRAWVIKNRSHSFKKFSDKEKERTNTLCVKGGGFFFPSPWGRGWWGGAERKVIKGYKEYISLGMGQRILKSE